MATVLNHDINGLCVRVNRFAEELYKSVSSGVGHTNQFDQARWQAYVNAFRTYKAWVMSQPQLDLPETHPREIEVETMIEMQNVENEAINDVLNLFKILKDEMLFSQSARLPAGIIVHDSLRIDALIDKIESLLTAYVAVVHPVDFPESSPQELVSGAGKTGI